MFFQRFTADDPDALAGEIESLRAAYAAAKQAGNKLAALNLAIDLAEKLTIAGREQEAHPLMMQHLPVAREQGDPTTLGWLLLNLATANQYLQRRWRV